MESRSVEEEERDVTGTWGERALTLISDHIEGEGESSECWSMSCLAQFRKLLGMPTTGFEKEILALLKKLKHKEEKTGKRRIKSRFERKLRKLECSVNYNRTGWGE